LVRAWTSDGSGGFDKTELRRVEEAGGLAPKGYIPVMEIGDEVIRESSVCVERVAQLSTEVGGASSLLPESPAVANELVQMCNALPKQPTSRALDALLVQANSCLASSSCLAGERFSIADACLLPFLQRVEDAFPADAEHLRAYMSRAHRLPAFSKTVAASACPKPTPPHPSCEARGGTLPAVRSRPRLSLPLILGRMRAAN
jgi:glutathione S-transferase